MLATTQLKEEHSAVKLILTILENICERISQGERIEPAHLERIIEFLRVFVDKCHHGKEEELLFPQLEKMGVKNEGGPVGVMLEEHVTGRKYIQGLSSAIKKYSEGTNSADKDIIYNAQGYIQLLTAHIYKEDNILFDLADRLLNEEMQSELVKEFDKIELERIGEGKHEEFHGMLHEFKHFYLG